MTKRSESKAPWDRKNPKKKAGGRSRKLTAAQKGDARSRARRAGRPYPNLVDNMAAARKTGKTMAAKKKSAKKRAAKSTRDH